MKIYREKISTRGIQKHRNDIGDRIYDTEIQGLQVWISKLKSTYYLRKMFYGKQYTIVIGSYPTMNIDEARLKTISTIREIESCIFDSKQSVRKSTVMDAIESYFKNCQDKNQANIKSYRSGIKKYESILNRPIISIKQEEIQNIHDSLQESPAMTNRITLFISTCITAFAKKRQVQINNPFKGVKLFEEKPRERYLNQEEMKRFVEALNYYKNKNETMYAVDAIFMMAYTGARKSNVCKMRFDEIHNGIWFIPAEKSKNGTEMKISLGHYENEIIERRRKISENGYVFELNGKPLKDIRYIFEKVCKKAAIKNLHPHDLRRTLGTWMLSTGSDLSVVAKRLGHKDIKVTQKVYAHIMPERENSAIETALDAMFKS